MNAVCIPSFQFLRTAYKYGGKVRSRRRGSKKVEKFFPLPQDVKNLSRWPFLPVKPRSRHYVPIAFFASNRLVPAIRCGAVLTIPTLRYSGLRGPFPDVARHVHD